MEIKIELLFLGIYDRSYDFETSHIMRYQVDFYDTLSGNTLSFNVYDNDKTSSLLNALLSLKRSNVYCITFTLTEKEKGLYKLNLKDVEVE